MKTLDYFILFAMCASIMVLVTLVIPKAMDKEVARMEAVRDYNCEHYAKAMNEWASEKGIDDVCEGV